MANNQRDALPARRAMMLTALPVEYQAVRDHLKRVREHTFRGTVYELGVFQAKNATWEVGIVEIGPGNATAAFEAERAISFFEPALIFFVGIAGGLKDVNIGDVVIGTRIYGYESGKDHDSGFLPRPDVGESSYYLVQRARAEARKRRWLRRIHKRASMPSLTSRVFVGPIAAGEKLIASTGTGVFSFLRSNYSDALAVEMEGRGFLQATHANAQVGSLVVRGISDLIINKSASDASGSQIIAAEHASAFAFTILANTESFSNMEESAGFGSRLDPVVVPFMVPRNINYFVARETELNELGERLRGEDNSGICSLHGMAGAGKSALAIQFAHQNRKMFPGGIFWIHLNRSTAMDALYTLAQGYEEGELISKLNTLGQRVSFVQGLLADKKALVVLDNATTSDQLEPLLQATASSMVIVTTRHNNLAALRDAYQIHVAPLPLEKAKDLISSILGKDISEKETSSIEELSKLTGSLPLALRIVAERARLSNFDLPTLSILLKERQLEELAYGREETKETSVRISFDLSYSHLSNPEKNVFVSLGVFEGVDFDVNAVAHVAKIDLSTAERVLENLYSLSLIQAGREGRWLLHPLIREYAREKIADDSPYIRMLEFFVTLAEQASLKLDGPEQHVWLNRLEDDYSSFRAALRWALTNGLAEEAEQIGGHLFWFWSRRGYLVEGYQWLEEILTLVSPSVQTAAHARTLFGAGALAWTLGKYNVAKANLEQCLVLWQKLADRRETAYALTFLSMTAASRGEHPAARSFRAQSLKLWRELGDRRGLAFSISYLGWSAQYYGDHESARILWNESKVIAQETNNERSMIWSLLGLGYDALLRNDSVEANKFLLEVETLANEIGDKWITAWSLFCSGIYSRIQGVYPDALLYLKQAALLCRELGDQVGLTWVTRELSETAMVMGDISQALEYLQDCFSLANQMRDYISRAWCAMGFAEILLTRDNPRLAAELVGAVEAFYSGAKYSPPPMHSSRRDRIVAKICEQLGKKEFAEFKKKGWQLTTEEVVNRALPFVDRSV